MAEALPIWLFVGAVCLHHVEEAYGAVAFARQAARLRLGVSATAVRLGLAIVTAVFVGVAIVATLGEARGPSAYLIAGLALAMIVNAFVPHVVATLATRAYAPGTATAVLGNLPAGAYLLCRSLRDGWVDPATFAYVGPAIAFAALALVAPLLWVSGTFVSRTGRGP